MALVRCALGRTIVFPMRRTRSCLPAFRRRELSIGRDYVEMVVVLPRRMPSDCRRSVRSEQQHEVTSLDSSQEG